MLKYIVALIFCSMGIVQCSTHALAETAPKAPKQVKTKRAPIKVEVKPKSNYTYVKGTKNAQTAALACAQQQLDLFGDLCAEGDEDAVPECIVEGIKACILGVE